MNLAETLMAMLILAYVAMLFAFIFHQKKGLSFIASFDKSLGYACILFLVGYGVTASAYVAAAWA